MRIFVLLWLAVLFVPPTWAAEAPAPGLTPNVSRFAVQVVATRDNQGLPFLVIDKPGAMVWVFAGQGLLLGYSAVLLGLAIGDDTVPGIGERKLASILPEERTTPAGRFASNVGRNLSGQEVLWVDYDSGVSMHRVIRGQPSERRAERLATPTSDDNRVSYGCINVPTTFFDKVLLPTVRIHGSIVYVLPETRPLQQVFGFLAGGLVP